MNSHPSDKHVPLCACLRYFCVSTCTFQLSQNAKSWSDYKRYRNKTRQLIRAAKRRYFSDSISDSKDSKFSWRHLRSLSGNKRVSSSDCANELIINDETFTGSENIATKLNEFFTSIADILKRGNEIRPVKLSADFHFTHSFKNLRKAYTSSFNWLLT